MSEAGLRKFLEALCRQEPLRADFSSLMAEFAKGAGYDVTSEDVGRYYSGLPRQRGDQTPSLTLAVGEDDRSSRGGERVTTLAVGEEDPPRGPGVG